MVTKLSGAPSADVQGLARDASFLEGAGPLPMSVAEVYRTMLFHGKTFQGIVSVDAIGPKGARATLRPSSPQLCLSGNVAGEWLIDPVVIDSALQVVVVWARLHWGVTLLPAAANTYQRLGSLHPGQRSLSSGCRPTTL
jgi:hypothetical protein